MLYDMETSTNISVICYILRLASIVAWFQGPGYCRYIVQMLMTDSWIYVGGVSVSLSFHSIWCLDDNLSIMYELDNLDASGAKKQTRMVG